MDGLENDNFTWSLSRACDNHRCEYFGKWISLHNELCQAVAKGELRNGYLSALFFLFGSRPTNLGIAPQELHVTG